MNEIRNTSDLKESPDILEEAHSTVASSLCQKEATEVVETSD